MVSRREIDPSGLTLHTDGVMEAYLDGTAMIRGVPPMDGSLPGPEPVEPFDAWMAEKLWVFNGGHAAAAYLGALAGCVTVDEAMARPEIRAEVRQVLVEASAALASMRGIRPTTRPRRDPGPLRRSVAGGPGEPGGPRAATQAGRR